MNKVDLSGMTGISYENEEGPYNNIATHEAIMNRLVEVLSPLKSDDDGPHNPTNTPSSVRIFSKPSTAAQARAVSRRVTGTEAPSPAIEQKERITEDASRKASIKVISANPCVSVQSKKEGEESKAHTPEHRIPGAAFTRLSSVIVDIDSTRSSERLVGSSDSKRKRPLEETLSSAHSCTEDSASSSPSKKVSKMASTELLLNGQSPHTPDGGRGVSGVHG